MDIKNSMLLANMMSKSGGGVEFKTYCYATDNAYIQTDISANADYKIRVKGQLTQYFTDTSKTFVFLGGIYYEYSKYTGTRFGVGYNPNVSRNVISLRSYNDKYIYEPTYSNDINVSTTVRPYSFDGTLNNTVPYNTNFVIFASSDFAYKSNDYIYIELIEIKDQNDNLIAELKPAIVNGESGMYDTVTETFYGNANSVGSLVCE